MRALRLSLLGAALATVVSLTVGVVDSGAKSTATWRVTIENLTPQHPAGPGAQPLSPPLFVTHAGRFHVWRVRAVASHVVAAIAEDANNAPAEHVLPQLAAVGSVFTGSGGAIPSGASRTYLVDARAEDRLSVVTMLVNTNDGFTGPDSLRLDRRRVVVESMAYDPGSEQNNELTGLIPGPCCNHPFVRAPEAS
jgi:hypothetical protein